MEIVPNARLLPKATENNLATVKITHPKTVAISRSCYSLRQLQSKQKPQSPPAVNVIDSVNAELLTGVPQRSFLENPGFSAS